LTVTGPGVRIPLSPPPPAEALAKAGLHLGAMADAVRSFNSKNFLSLECFTLFSAQWQLHLAHMYYVYILKCKDNSPYTGFSEDLKERISRHQKGTFPQQSQGFQ
jgi:predicted GIY-YIG superfamily endonuclease